ncbi:dimethylmenaquinone methyltransferase [Sinomonas sp. R1AF57]|nr:dimethylmenaquinone methyltransferase [Sinomonas sp. R1AF57]
MVDESHEWIAQLRELDTCVVSDALDALGLPGAVSDLIRLSGDAPVVGRAVTVDLVSAEQGPAAPSTRHLATAAVATSGPEEVIVVAHPGLPCAGWGGLLTKAASLRGIAGTLVDGPVRDVDESRALGYSILGRSATPVTARGRLVEDSWSETITFAGVRVATGDLVRADGSGIVFIPFDRAAEVIERARQFAARESAMSAALDQGEVITAVMGASYEELAGRVAHS